MSGAFFDFQSSQAQSVQASLTKMTFTGSYYSDLATWNVTQGTHDNFLTASQVNTSPSQYDYLGASFSMSVNAGVQFGSSPVFGIGVVNN